MQVFGSNKTEGSSKAFPPTIPDAVMPAHCVMGSLRNTHERLYSPSETLWTYFIAAESQKINRFYLSVTERKFVQVYWESMFNYVSLILCLL